MVANWTPDIPNEHERSNLWTGETRELPGEGSRGFATVYRPMNAENGVVVMEARGEEGEGVYPARKNFMASAWDQWTRTENM